MNNVFHILPRNLIPSGGIKVHYQLVQLEQELGYNSYIVYEDRGPIPTWFEYSVKHLTIPEMMSMLDKEHDIVVGWEQPEPVLRTGAYHKVCYIQGEVFVNRNFPYPGIDLWFSTNFNRNAVLSSCPYLAGNRYFMMNPFIDRSVFDWDFENFYRNKVAPKRDRIMIQARKAGHDAILKVFASEENIKYPIHALLNDKIDIVTDCPESEFAGHLKDSSIFIAHSFPEGLGLPGLEAMACGTRVVGFTGGGGTDYMIHGDNCFIAKDGDYDGLAHWLYVMYKEIESDPEYMLLEMEKTVEKFSRSNTEQQLIQALTR